MKNLQTRKLKLKLSNISGKKLNTEKLKIFNVQLSTDTLLTADYKQNNYIFNLLKKYSLRVKVSTSNNYADTMCVKFKSVKGNKDILATMK